jgi:hypothetical protein
MGLSHGFSRSSQRRSSRFLKFRILQCVLLSLRSRSDFQSRCYSPLQRCGIPSASEAAPAPHSNEMRCSFMNLTGKHAGSDWRRLLKQGDQGSSVLAIWTKIREVRAASAGQIRTFRAVAQLGRAPGSGKVSYARSIPLC